MSTSPNSITLTIPQSIADEMAKQASDWNGRMHELLERNTDGDRNASERRELQALVLMAQFSQIPAMAHSLPPNS